MKIFRIRDYRQYASHVQKMQCEYSRYAAVAQSLVPPSQQAFVVAGYSYPAGRSVDFAVDFTYAVEGRVNWRERLVCPVTGLNNRLRAAVHLFETDAATYPGDAIYISEQTTAFYGFLASHYQNVTGSEYLGTKVGLGEQNERGIRNEDLTQLTFSDGSFDRVISLDCFEHFPAYQTAFRECRRILKPGGKMLWSVPFDANSQRNICRARVRPDGSIEHLLPPEYHGDPLSQAGCLCFNVFGWEMLGQMLAAGFADAYAILFWSEKFGYLGSEQMSFVAVRS